MKIPHVVCSTVAMLCTTALAQQASVATPSQTLPVTAPDLQVDDAVVVQFDPLVALVMEATGRAGEGTIGVTELDLVARRHLVRSLRKQFVGAQPLATLPPGRPDLSGYYVVSFDPAMSSVDEVLADFTKEKLVISAEAIGIHPVMGTPNDGYYANQWFLNQASDKDIDAPEAWNVWTGSSNTTVAVLDTGVRYYHKDLGGVNASSTNTTAADGNMWINTAEKNGVAGVDDDGNGFVDDWVGYDFVSAPIATCWSGEDCSGADADPRDFNGHGTHCAGLVGAMNNNGYAVSSAGGGWGSGANSATGNGVRVMALRVGHSASSGGQEVGYVRMDFAASAFYYAAQNGAKVASCSWGSSNSGGLAAAVDNFVASGGLIFKAAGNANTQTADYMCSRADVYSVAALSQTDAKASFSSYGTWVDISAPGVAIYSTYHNHAAPASDYVAALDGTSMATPLVASCAGSLWSANPTWTAAQVWQRLKDTCDNISAANPSYVGKLGAGRVNLNSALTGSGGGGGGGSQAIVDCLTYNTSGGNGGTKNLLLAVSVVDGNGAPVSSASVTVVISSSNNSYTLTATTGANGTANFTVNNAANTCWTTDVTNIVKAGFTFDGAEPANGFRKGTDARPDADCRSSNDPCG